MSIKFTCECCKKKIKAPDKAGGKWGKCPHCDHKCYVPLPPASDDEELTLAPLDETQEIEYEQKMRETHDLTDNILHEVEAGSGGGFDETEEQKLRRNIISYLKLMADGMLDEAEVAESRIAEYSRQALRMLGQIDAAKEKPKQLQDIAPRVLSGIIKKIKAELA